MRIGEMFLGYIDANSEIYEMDSDAFVELFCDNPSFDLNRIMKGSAYYICGDKGTGKTMFLRYAELKAKEESFPTKFVRYKKDISDHEKSQLRQAGEAARDKLNSDEYVEGCQGKDYQKIDYVLGWQLYLINTIVDLIESTESSLFDRASVEWNLLTDLLKDAYGKTEVSFFKRLLPKLDKGQLSIQTKHAKLVCDFKPKNQSDRCSVKFSELAHGIINIYQRLPRTSSDVPIFVFIDEIELAYRNKSQYEKEAELIGDLIIAVDDMNRYAKENNYPIRVVMALRNEVSQAIRNNGREINKPIEDYGMRIDWKCAASELDNSPLLKIVETRIGYNLDKKYSTKSIWKDYFPDSVDDTPIKAYFLNQTWQKPRDVVRLLKELQNKCSSDTRFTKEAFYYIRPDYSQGAWNEIAEELSATFRAEEIDAMKKILTGITIEFGLDDFIRKIEKESELYPNVEALSKKRRAPELINILFRAGIIINLPVGGKKRSFALGAIEPDVHGVFVVHYPLRSVFDVRQKDAGQHERRNN